MSRPFDGRLEGTPVERWREDGRRDRLPRLELPEPVERLLVVVAHADDETLGCGGTLALARRRGLAVDVVIVTDGAAAHGAPDTTLASTRRDEAAAALLQLGAGIGLEFLEVPDSTTPEHRDRIAAHVRRRAAGAPGTVLLLSTWTSDGHRDHRVVGEVCATIAAEYAHPLLAAPIWLWHWADPDDDEVPWSALARVALDEEALARTRRARACYRSQTEPGPDGSAPVLHPLFVRTFAGDDRLVRVRGWT
ncbi:MULTISPECIES: PIG-L deacetylase family protein [unclassified Rathayibacter]|uniref:PIG-L deacetylase family protein n=1 Tax=unclassified Rathayibacter TaxID=2609250 RepID=UPI00188C9BBF|nr:MULTISPECIES: PIG-L family deacetylase [unclassified Rathayibacter]MBF4462963.1 PIG-L family deacetylase [Rathayibacter sp. VKM Ac-2879]MBF4504377.1 PIG-L family deacetylase [Rathayibacter sp. VKM Ac-2878]